MEWRSEPGRGGEGHGAARPALGFYRAALSTGLLGQPWRKAVLREAIDAARAAGEREQATAWERKLAAAGTL